MDKATCVINPKTKRAVKADSRLGKQILASQKNVKKEPNTMYKKPIGPVKPKPEPKKEAPKPEPKKETPKRTKKEPTKVVKEPSNKDKEDAVKKLQAVLKRKVSKKPAPEPTPMASGGVKTKYDADYIKKYAKHIYDKYPEEGLKKALDKAENGDRVKEIYDDYITGMNKSMITLGKIIDQELTKEEKLKLFKEDKLVSKMYYRSSNLRDVMQGYLFKFEEPAE